MKKIYMGGGSIKKVLEKDIREINKIKLSIISLIFILLIGVIAYKTGMMYSYAIFTDSIVGEKTIELTYMPERTKEFKYTGNYEEYEVPQSGYYYIELGGASGGSYESDINGGMNGAVTSGYIKLDKGDKLYFYVGQKGTDKDTNCRESGYEFNGGGIARPASGNICGPTGGGATDVRLESGEWYNINSLLSRIMVAGAGGGGSVNDSMGRPYGGTLYGAKVTIKESSTVPLVGNQGTQTAGGAEPTKFSAAQSNGTAGSFGKGGYGGASAATASTGGGCGGGSGYYGASGSTGIYNGTYASAGGSSYISGYAGVNSVKDDVNITHTNDTLHYSGKYFIGGEMLEGQNSGNGYAKITYVGEKPKRKDDKLDNVRYIRNCTNQNSINSGNFWGELQAIYEGKNIAKGKPVEGTYKEENDTTRSYKNIVDGIIDHTGSSGFGNGTTTTGNQCIIVDLGANYDLDEVAVWNTLLENHARTYYDNITSVSSDKSKWIEVINEASIETSNGHRVNAYSEHINGYVQDGLVLWYDGYANTGNIRNFTTPTWKDLSGNNNDLTISGDATWNGDNLQFDGAGCAYKNPVDYKINNEYTLQVVSMPVSATGGDASYSYYQRIFTNSYSGSSGYAYIDLSYIHPSFDFSVADGSSTSINNTFSIGEDGLNKIYSTSSILKGNTLYAYNGSALKNQKQFDFTPKMTISGVYVGGSASNYLTFKGKVYSIRVYNRALTDEELLHNYNLDKLKYSLE